MAAVTWRRSVCVFVSARSCSVAARARNSKQSHTIQRHLRDQKPCVHAHGQVANVGVRSCGCLCVALYGGTWRLHGGAWHCMAIRCGVVGLGGRVWCGAVWQMCGAECPCTSAVLVRRTCAVQMCCASRLCGPQVLRACCVRMSCVRVERVVHVHL